MKVTMRKKDVRIADQRMLNITAKLNSISNVSDASNALKLLFGEDPITASVAFNIGLNYGLLKAIVLDNYANCQVIAIPSLKKLSSFGFIKNQKSN
jgi:hypothetical protein